MLNFPCKVLVALRIDTGESVSDWYFCSDIHVFMYWASDLQLSR